MTAVIQIQKAIELFRSKKQTIKLGLSSEDAAYELSQIMKRVTKFSNVATQLALDNKMENTNTMITSAVDEGKYEILTSALAIDFAEKYKLQLRAYESFESLKNFLETTFQSRLSKSEKLTIARKKISQVTRFSDENETFENLLSRLNTLTIEIKNNSSTEVAELFKEDAFNRNLSPENKSFLLDHGYNSKTLDEQARFLDERKKYMRKLEVNHIERKDLHDQNKKIDDLTHQIAALTALVKDSCLHESPSQDPKPLNLQPQLNPPAPSWPQEVNAIRPQNENRTRGSFRPTWSKQGQKSRCQQCGLSGHSSSHCPRTCTAVCYKCHKRGHLQAVCRSAKNLQ